MVSNVLITNENLFKLQCLIKTTKIQHSTQCKLKRKLFIALATSSADIILYFKKEPSYPPLIKRISWFQGSHKQIAAFCFDSSGTWLLCATLDGSLYILPTLILISENYSIDKRWKMNDVTYISFINSQLSNFRPMAIAWWKSIKISIDIGIIGTECGTIIFINLLNGQQIGITHVNGSIYSLHVCQNESNEDASLLITSKFRQQWRLPLDQHICNVLHNYGSKDSYGDVNLKSSICNNTENTVLNKSKLQELKQLSVEKLAVFKQKLIETKNQTLGESSQCHNNASNREPSVNSEISESKSSFFNLEPISKDTFFSPQYDREGRQLYTCYYPVTNQITVHGPNLTVVPLSVHQVFESCEILLAHRFFFITDINQNMIYIISDQLSKTHINKDCKFNSESIVGTFSFENNKEMIRAMYKVTKFHNATSKKIFQEIENKCILSKNLKDMIEEEPSLDLCIIVTNHCVYEVILRKSPLSIFMELVLKKSELLKAGKLTILFGLSGPHLFEYAGDILLLNKIFSRAVTSYKMSKSKLLKSVLKFASVGHTSELLNCLTHCLLTPVIIEMPIAMRIHLSNLCVLAFIEMILRVWSEQSKTIYKEFLYFLSTNTFYDELLAINIAGQTYLWEISHHLATQRCLYGQMLDIVIKAIQIFGTSDFHLKSYGLLICLSESDLMQAMLLNHDLARSHMSFIRNNLQDFQIFVLQRLITLYDPTNPVLRPKLLHYKVRHGTLSYNLQSRQCYSSDITDNIDQPDTLAEEIVEMFLLILLTLIHKKQLLNPNYKPTLLYDVQLSEISKEHSNIALHVDFKRRLLNAGFSHVALIRNDNVYTWGSLVQGCLGTGSSVLRYGAPHAVCFFRSMDIKVFSVSCGHCHTLAVTNNGIYAWGANQFGQLGLGKVLQCSNPELVTFLAQEIIVDAVAGQYHSVALTADGRIFTWGWGIHGQLGHGNTDEKATPTLVTALLGVVVYHISAGYAHTLALSVDGVVYAFGCNVLGQLGVGGNTKSSTPLKISLPDKITLISTAYFHNLAVSNMNKLYIWGASPQILRLQAQAQKKTRVLEQQDANEKRNKTWGKISNSAVNLNKEMKEFLEEDQVKSVQTETIASNVEMQKKPFEITGFENINIDLIEENQTHLKPSVVDTSLIKGQITQISAGCHHNALITKDGSLYMWGRNLDGQIGNGTRREVLIPTPLYYNSACIVTQIPPRHNDSKRTQNQRDLDSHANDLLSDNGNLNASRSTLKENLSLKKEKINSTIHAIDITCGYDYTVAIQPGGTVLAWGNNSRAQLGRIPVREMHDADDKLLLLKSSKRLVRLPNTLHIALDVPSQVPGISAPIISYRSNDAFSLSGLVRPLSVIEKIPGELTLNYILEYFYGLYRSADVMEKCIKLENYQACSKIAALEDNILAAFTYQLKVLHKLSLQSSGNYSNAASEILTIEESAIKITSQNADSIRNSALSQNIKKNTELFNRQAEKNFMESLGNSVTRNWKKIPTSRSLNNLQTLAQELYSFDCQGGSEELYKTRKNNALFLNSNVEYSNIECNINEDEQQKWIKNLIFNENNLLLQYKNIAYNSIQNLSRLTCEKTMLNVNDNQTDQHDAECAKKMMFSNKVCVHSQRNCIINESIKALKFYLNKVSNKADTLKYKLLQSAIGFWIEHDLPMQSLENVFFEYIHMIYYPLGLLLFCQNAVKKYLDANNCDNRSSNWCASNLFSIRFCLQMLSMLMQHIEKDNIMSEYIKIFSSLMADNYGISLNGYPGMDKNSSDLMMDEIIGMVFSEMENARLFAHIKDSNAVNRLLMAEEDNVIFTCGHHFSFSVYKTEIIPMMETELLVFQSLILPFTSQYLGNMFSCTSNLEILCPLCTVKALRPLIKRSFD